MPFRLPNPHSPEEVRRAFGSLKAPFDIITQGPVGSVLVGAGVGVVPIWGTELTSLTKLVVDNITIDAAAITSDTGAISFGDENLTTTGTVAGVNVTSGADPGHTHSIYLKADGSVALTGNMAVDALITIDGRDISVDGVALDSLVTDFGKVKVDAGATAGYLGAAFSDGVLRTSTGISYADGGNFITLTTNDGQIVHDNLSGFSANRHVDHTAVTLTAGSGLSGGGTIAANRSFALNIDGLDVDTIVGGDTVVFYDDTGAHNNKTTFANFNAALDHGALLGRGDDDHSQYHTDGRAATWLAANHETTYNHANFATAYGWGDHGVAGYLKADGTVPLTADWTTGAFSIIGSDHWYLRSDSAKIFFGENDDASIYYDGTNLVINPREVGSGFVDLRNNAIAVGNLEATSESDFNFFGIERYGNHVNCGMFLSKKSRGTSASPIGINNADNLLRFSVQGMQSNGVYSLLSGNSDVMRANGVGAWTTANHGRVLQFLVTPQGTTASIIGLEITPVGDVEMRGDDRTLLLGEARDAGVSYDGTNLVLTPSLVGSGAVSIEGANSAEFPLLHVLGTDNATFRIESTGASKQSKLDWKTATQWWTLGNYPTLGGKLALYDRSNGRFLMQWNPGTTPSVSIVRTNSKLFWGAADNCSIMYNGTDMVLTPDDSGTGAVKVVGDMFFSSAGSGLPHGDIFGYEVGATITITGTGAANKVQVTSFAEDGESNMMTPSHANDHITVLKTGIYLVTASVSISSLGGTSYEMDFACWINNGATELRNIHAHRRLSGGGSDTGSKSLSGTTALTAGDTLELWCYNATNTNDVVIESLTLSAVMVGG